MAKVERFDKHKTIVKEELEKKILSIVSSAKKLD